MKAMSHHDSSSASEDRHEPKPLWVELLEGTLLIWIIDATLATVAALCVLAYRA